MAMELALIIYKGNKMKQIYNIQAISDYYDNAPHAPDDVKVKAAYDALKSDLLLQYKKLSNAGYSIQLVDSDLKDGRFKTSDELRAEIAASKQVDILSSLTAFGQKYEDLDFTNPLLADTNLVDVNGLCLVYNDILRLTHDVFAHFFAGANFTTEGEIKGVLAHAELFSEEALPALYFELIAQRCYYECHGHYATQKTNIINLDYFKF